jgi:hypothetical protein
VAPQFLESVIDYILDTESMGDGRGGIGRLSPVTAPSRMKDCRRSEYVSTSKDEVGSGRNCVLMKNSARGAEPEVRASLAKLEGRVLDRQLPSPANPTVCTLTMMATCCLSPSHSRLRWTRSSNLNATLTTTPNLAPTFRHSPSYRLFRLTRRMETCTNLRMVTTKPPADRSGSLFGPRGVQRRHQQTNANQTGHWQTKA